MGKGDKKTKRGKIVLGTYGVRRRPEKSKKMVPTAQKEVVEKIEKQPESKPVVARKRLKTAEH